MYGVQWQTIALNTGQIELSCHFKFVYFFIHTQPNGQCKIIIAMRHGISMVRYFFLCHCCLTVVCIQLDTCLKKLQGIWKSNWIDLKTMQFLQVFARFQLSFSINPILDPFLKPSNLYAKFKYVLNCVRTWCGNNQQKNQMRICTSKMWSILSDTKYTWQTC